MTSNICLKIPDFSSNFCDFPWLFQYIPNFPDWKMPSHFSSANGNPGNYIWKRLRLQSSYSDVSAEIISFSYTNTMLFMSFQRQPCQFGFIKHGGYLGAIGVYLAGSKTVK